jgi:hypothetical protein
VRWPAQGSELEPRSAEERERETGKRVTTRTGASTGNGGGLSAPGASAEAASSRAGRWRARRPMPGGCPRSRKPVVARRYASLRHRASPELGQLSGADQVVQAARWEVWRDLPGCSGQRRPPGLGNVEG